jgi:hypothetical protein
MPHLANCQTLLRRLISKGDPSAIPLAENAIDAYLDITPSKARRSGLRVLQQDALDQHGALVGVQRSFAETVSAYIERKLVRRDLELEQQWGVELRDVDPSILQASGSGTLPLSMTFLNESPERTAD